MGLFDNFGDVLGNIAGPIISAVTGSPFTAAISQGANVANTQAPVMERQKMADLSYGSTGFNRGMSTPVAQISPSNGGFFSNISGGIRDFATGLSDFVTDIRPAADILGLNLPGGNTAPPAAQTIIRQAPDESASSGEITGANLGMGGALIQAARGFARSPAGQGLIGGGLGVGGALVASSGSGMPRITRRMKSDVRKIYMMAGMDPNATAQILNRLGTYPRFNFDAGLVFLILTKRFRNDGPVVTKAAVRKTKTTLRRMKGVVDMYNSVCKPTTRRAPARRAAPKAVQLIKN